MGYQKNGNQLPSGLPDSRLAAGELALADGRRAATVSLPGAPMARTADICMVHIPVRA